MSSSDTTPRRPGGRLLDQTRDAAIRVAVLDLLAEVGYDRLTVEGVAARVRAGKGTIYRRWPSKALMVIDALADLKLTEIDLPDTGTVEGDIRALFRQGLEGAARTFPLAAGLAAAFLTDPELADAFRQRFMAPRVARFRQLLDRAVERGQIEPLPDIDLVLATFPAFMLQRTILGDGPPDITYVSRILERVVIPMVTRRWPAADPASPPPTSPPSPASPDPVPPEPS